MISTFFLIDDAEMMLTKMEPQQKKLRLSLRHTRRAFTNDNEDGYVTKICKLYPLLTLLLLGTHFLGINYYVNILGHSMDKGFIFKKIN